LISLNDTNIVIQLPNPETASTHFYLKRKESFLFANYLTNRKTNTTYVLSKDPAKEWQDRESTMGIRDDSGMKRTEINSLWQYVVYWTAEEKVYR
jgi:hypothetical protein